MAGRRAWIGHPEPDDAFVDQLRVRRGTPVPPVSRLTTRLTFREVPLLDELVYHVESCARGLERRTGAVGTCHVTARPVVRHSCRFYTVDLALDDGVRQVCTYGADLDLFAAAHAAFHALERLLSNRDSTPDLDASSTTDGSHDGYQPVRRVRRQSSEGGDGG